MLQYFETLQDNSGNALVGATVTVRTLPALALATIYATNGTASPVPASTVTADATGQVSFYVPDGAYQLTYIYNGTTYKTKSPVQMLDPMGFVSVPDTGAPNAYVVTDSRFPANLITGMKFEFVAGNTNTASSTLNMNGTGAQPIVQPGGSGLIAGMIQGNGRIRVEWTGAAWELVGSQSQPFYGLTTAESGAIPPITPLNFGYSTSGDIDIRRYCTLVLDGATDNTASLTAAMTALAGYRGPLLIPYNCKYSLATIMPIAPVGLMFLDESSVNTGQPPGYKNKTRVFWSNDSVSDDSNTAILSTHHPALRLNNTHTAGTTGATQSFHSILRDHGYRWNNDPICGLQWLTLKSSRGNLWRSSDVLNTSYDFAVNAAAHWLTATSYTNGVSRVNTTDGGVWIATSTGTSGATEPNGTGPTFNDGGVTWSYQGLWNAGRTVFFYDEDGFGGVRGSVARWGADGLSNSGCSINFNESTGDTFVRDDKRGSDLIRYSTAGGVQIGALRSLKRGAVLSGATPAITNELHLVTNGGATNMTGIVPPTGQTQAIFTLYFTNGNTTVKATGFNLKGGVDVVPTANQMMTFMLDTGISANPTEMSRNF